MFYHQVIFIKNCKVIHLHALLTTIASNQDIIKFVTLCGKLLICAHFKISCPYYQIMKQNKIMNPNLNNLLRYIVGENIMKWALFYQILNLPKAILLIYTQASAHLQSLMVVQLVNLLI